VVRRAHLVVTGTYRSGTTFAERLLDNLGDGFCASQPFPFLYLSAKRRYLAETGKVGGRYPIGSGFHDPLHHPDELAAFLGSEVFDRRAIDDAFLSMQGYSGAWTPALSDVVRDLAPGPLGPVVRAMHAALAERRAPAATLLASKEILLEEFIPTLNEAGIGVLLVVRDPRAVVASTLGPSAEEWSGRPRPLLYTIQLWRKSVAYALKYREQVSSVRLEDLVAEPEDTLRACLQSLDVEIECRVPDHLIGANGAPWQPNTSFPAGAASGPRFGLSDRQLAYVEALAGPEMRALGYRAVTGSSDDALEALHADDDPGGDHPDFEPRFSVDPERLALEHGRLLRLRTGEIEDDEARWFVLPGVGRLLTKGS
jgi:hypothetical protein